MGTASRWPVLRALGIGLPMNAAIPAVDSHRYTLAHIGRRAVEMAHEDLRMSKILTCKALKTLFAWLATADPPTR